MGEEVNLYVLTAVGDRHVGRAAFCADLLRRYTGNKVVTVAARASKDVDVMVDVPASLNDAQASRYLKTSVHRHVRLGPGDVAYYLDNDVLPASGRIDSVFGHYRPPITFGRDAGKTVRSFSKYATRGIGLADAIARRFRTRPDPGWPIWNGGAFLFGPESGSFLDTWHRSTLSVFGDPAWSDRDQGTLVAAVWLHGLQDHSCLSSCYNWLHRLHSGLRSGPSGLSGPEGPVHFVHFPVSYGDDRYETWRRVVGSGVGGRRSYLVRSSGDWHLQVAHRVVGVIRSRGHSAEFTSEPYEGRHGRHQLRKTVIIESSDGSFAVADFKDHLNPSNNFVVRELVREPACRRVLKSQYRHGYYSDDRIVPYTYFEKDPELCQSMLDRLRGMRRSSSSLFFRGRGWAGRRRILNLLGVPERDPVGMERYLLECSRHLLALALPGHGNVCHREIECFGMGTAVIMPRLKNVFHDPLIPDVHYFAVDAVPGRDPPEKIAGAIERVRADCLADRARTKAVAVAAMAWYDRNVRFPESIELTLDLADVAVGGPMG